ncbi:DUF1275 domain-containing protein, partial [Clavibacter michiganensis]
NARRIERGRLREDAASPAVDERAAASPA